MIFEKHVFICTRCSFQEENGTPCDPNTAADFRKSVKAQAKQLYPDRKIRVNASGCLGQCERGISAVIYPEADWLLDLRPGDEEKILEKLSK